LFSSIRLFHPNPILELKMQSIPQLAAMGRRIMINGPSNAGKSTLADAIARKLDIPVIHLDRFSHEDEGRWIPRDKAEFRALHDSALTGDAWVMDGNYSELMSQRFERATGVVVIDDHFIIRYIRYFNRTLLQRRRIGGLINGLDSLNWLMIRWIWTTRNSVEKYRRAAIASGLPHILISNRAELDQLYAFWKLHRRH
jgi:adenylate kinase family enzyme